MSVGDRLRQERSRLGHAGQADFARLAGVAPNTQSNYERNLRSPDAEYLQAVAQLGVDVGYVVTGQHGIAEPRADYLPAPTHVRVPRYDIAASAGNGTVTQVHDEAIVDSLAFSEEWIREIGVSPARLVVIRVRGDSMMSTLHDGDLVLVDTAVIERRVNGVYVLVKGDALLIKRLNFRLNGSVEITSDNPAYAAEVVQPHEFDQLHIVGRMVRRVVR